MEVWADRKREQAIWVDTFGKSFLPQVAQDRETLKGLPKDFIPGRIYFSTPLSDNPDYTKEIMPTWVKISSIAKSLEYTVYAPFKHTDPHASSDGYNSYQIAFLDHFRVLESELSIFDLNMPSRGVGQEVEMGIFIPQIGFSKSPRVSRLVKGMAGMLVLKYENESELLDLIKGILGRKDWKEEPFHVARCENHPVPAIFKGNKCLNCELKDYLHDPLVAR